MRSKTGASARHLRFRYYHLRPRMATAGPETEVSMDIIKDFDSLPNDAVVPRQVTAALLHVSERTVRRRFRTVKLSARRRGNRVGDIRAIARGYSAAEADEAVRVISPT
jgi:hypothetical protein